MIIHARNSPTTFHVAIRGKRLIIVDHQGYAHTREDVAELIQAATSHLDVFPTEQIVLEENIRHDEARRQREGEIAAEQSSHPKSRVVREGFVYLCRNNRNGLVKIGFSTNPRRRERTLQSEEPELEFVHIFRGTMADEKALHDLFAGSRKRGEWFDLAWHHLQAIIAENVPATV